MSALVKLIWDKSLSVEYAEGACDNDGSHECVALHMLQVIQQPGWNEPLQGAHSTLDLPA